MTDAPERIWANDDEWHRHWYPDAMLAMPEYIREDLHTAEVARLQARVAELEGALTAINGMGQTAVQSHWDFRRESRAIARAALKGDA